MGENRLIQVRGRQADLELLAAVLVLHAGAELVADRGRVLLHALAKVLVRLFDAVLLAG